MSELDDFFNETAADESEVADSPAVQNPLPSTPLDTLRAAVDILKAAARWTDGEARADIERARARIESILENST